MYQKNRPASHSPNVTRDQSPDTVASDLKLDASYITRASKQEKAAHKLDQIDEETMETIQELDDNVELLFLELDAKRKELSAAQLTIIGLSQQL